MCLETLFLFLDFKKSNYLPVYVNLLPDKWDYLA